MFVNITEDDRASRSRCSSTLGKAGGAAMADAEAMGRLISLALRSGIPMHGGAPAAARHLVAIARSASGPNKVLSVPDAIGIALEEWWREKQGVQQDLLSAVPRAEHAVSDDAARVGRRWWCGRRRQGGAQAQLRVQAYNGGESFMGTCPDCGSQLEYAEGCVKCHVCGFSECG